MSTKGPWNDQRLSTTVAGRFPWNAPLPSRTDFRLGPVRIQAGVYLRGLLLGISVWLALGFTCTVVESGMSRTLGLLPSPWFLAASLVGAIVLLHLLRAGTFAWPLVSIALLTTGAAWLPVPPMPWIHAWSSPASLIVFVSLAVGLARARAPLWRAAGHGPWMAAVVASVLMASVWFALRGRAISGDEPHYLLIAQSLLTDGDIDLRNNYDARDYSFYYGGWLEPRHVSLGVLGQEYSFHGPGVALLALPAFAIGGPLGARLFLALVVACCSGALWAAIHRLTASPGSAWIGWAAFVLCAPVGLNSASIYPDGPAAAATALGIWALAETEGGRPPSLAALAGIGLALAALPFLHVRLALIAACLGAGLGLALFKHADRVMRIGALLVAPVAGAALFFGSSWYMFGTFDPTAVFRQKAAGSLSAVPAGLLGLLFDQEYGLLPWAPVFLIAPVAVIFVWRRLPILAASAGVAAAGTLVLAASWVWWGGQSAPARFLVPVLPILALGVGAAWSTMGSVGRAFVGVGLAFSASMTTLVATAVGGAYVTNDPDGRGTLFEWMSPSVDLSTALPSVFRAAATTSSEAIVALIWVATASLLVAACHLWARRRRPDEAQIWAGVVVASVLGLSLGAASAWSWRGLSPWTGDRAQLALLWSAGLGSLPTAMMSPGPRVVSRRQMLSAIAVKTPRSDSSAALLHVPMAPAGRYRVEVDPAAGAAAAPQHLTLELGRNAWPFAVWDAADPAPSFTTAFPLWAIRVTGEASDRPLPPEVRLRPVDVRPPASGRRELAWSATPYGALVVYSLDLASYPERGGLWLAADRLVALALADRDGRSRAAQLHLEAGPAPVTIDIRDEEGWRSQLVLAAGARGRIDAPAHSTGVPRPVLVRISGGFPAADGRRLGAWMSVE